MVAELLELGDGSLSLVMIEAGDMMSVPLRARRVILNAGDALTKSGPRNLRQSWNSTAIRDGAPSSAKGAPTQRGLFEVSAGQRRRQYRSESPEPIPRECESAILHDSKRSRFTMRTS